MSDYVEKMRAVARDSYDELYAGVDRLIFTDFPDYPNVGDSAIALGQLAYFEYSGVEVSRAYCIGTLSASVYRSTSAVMINGGGNIAGFFRGIDEHRYGIAEKLDEATPLIQAPQSVHFARDGAAAEFIERFARRPGLRFAVRDATALALLEGLGVEASLAPDAVHHLGRIAAPEPQQRHVVLRRADRESNSLGRGPIEGEVDWLRDVAPTRAATWLRWKVRYMGQLGQLLNPKPSRWEKIAGGRLARGVNLLSRGEVVITDRLHAMLIALQMGRRVIAVDNSNLKLTKYADTWFGTSSPDVSFAKNFDEALRHSARLQS